MCVCLKVRLWCVCDLSYRAAWCVLVLLCLCAVCLNVFVCLFVVYCVMLYGMLFVPFYVCCVFVFVWFVCDRMCDGVWRVVVDWLCACGRKKTNVFVRCVWDVICEVVWFVFFVFV